MFPKLLFELYTTKDITELSAKRVTTEFHGLLVFVNVSVRIFVGHVVRK
jgi:hypothetical protein